MIKLRPVLRLGFSLPNLKPRLCETFRWRHGELVYYTGLLKNLGIPPNTSHQESLQTERLWWVVTNKKLLKMTNRLKCSEIVNTEAQHWLIPYINSTSWFESAPCLCQNLSTFKSHLLRQNQSNIPKSTNDQSVKVQGESSSSRTQHSGGRHVHKVLGRKQTLLGQRSTFCKFRSLKGYFHLYFCWELKLIKLMAWLLWDIVLI